MLAAILNEIKVNGIKGLDDKDRDKCMDAFSQAIQVLSYPHWVLPVLNPDEVVEIEMRFDIISATRLLRERTGCDLQTAAQVVKTHRRDYIKSRIDAEGYASVLCAVKAELNISSAQADCRIKSWINYMEN